SRFSGKVMRAKMPQAPPKLSDAVARCPDIDVVVVQPAVRSGVFLSLARIHTSVRTLETLHISM
ncbi:MAG: hypothetical protein RIF41_14040, partial [Polyangiaceae bacterium]